jgi:hypothetical protein
MALFAIGSDSARRRGVRGVAPPSDDCAVAEDMHQMVFNLGVPVTPGADNTGETAI